LAGMTGTAATEAEEFHKIYKLDVVSVPTHRQMIREDHPDVIYKTQIAKYNAVVDLIDDLHKRGQPILVGTTSIEKNEFLSNLLKKRKISHALLNAKNHEKEAEIIAEAGKVGSVTVATNMAGRGVDIKLGEEADKLGGLYVIGTERHESRRIDNQLRGRSGRQGDPGASKFFVSLEDDLMRIFGGDQVAKVMNFLKIPEDQPIEHSMISKALETAQIKVEGHNFDIRKHTVEYDDVMNQQRQIIYGIRLKALDASAEIGPDRRGLKEEVLKRIDQEIKKLVVTHTEEGVDFEKIAAEFITIIPFDQNSAQDIKSQLGSLPSVEEIESLLIKISHDMYAEREKQLGVNIVREMEIFAFLNTIDTLWIEHLDNMDDLRTGIGLRSFGQREPLVEYKREAFEMFERLVQSIDHEIVYQIYKLTPSGYQHPQSIQAEERFPILETGVEIESQELKEVSQGKSISEVLQTEGGTTKVTIERGGEVISRQVLDSSGSIHNKQKPGRNDPCHCGSGKKYKRCHYPN
ncbi:MAG: SEC-C metal-binding domain-containing protein, partial [Candidatus Daviesbacteria bacterium]|nr:SEC-C metal-binding domain-containing protein [Candidatus Daviesbacteria bacterium]